MRIGINIAAPQHEIHILLSNGLEFTDKDIQRWASGQNPELGLDVLQELLGYFCQIIVQKTLKGKALELWQRFFDGHDAPWETNDYGQTYCFFCAGDHPDHHSNCIYVAAAKLLGRELTIKVGY